MSIEARLLNKQGRERDCSRPCFVFRRPRRLRRTLYVDVVADHAAEDATDSRADETALDLVAACRRANHCTRGGADRCVTTGMLLDGRLRCRIVAPAAAARACTRRTAD